jgi:hypothetical protein
MKSENLRLYVVVYLIRQRVAGAVMQVAHGSMIKEDLFDSGREEIHC